MATLEYLPQEGEDSLPLVSTEVSGPNPTPSSSVLLTKEQSRAFLSEATSLPYWTPPPSLSLLCVQHMGSKYSSRLTICLAFAIRMKSSD